MSVVSDQVYIFGGATVKCLCHFDSNDNQERCASKNVFSDELWYFDLISSEFSLLETTRQNETPQGREQHTMTLLPDNSVILVGGVSTEDNDMLINEDLVVLGDVWRLYNPHNITSHVIDVRNSAGDKLPIVLTSGNITDHKIEVTQGSLGFGVEEKKCIKDVQVEISLDLDCDRDLDHISLFGKLDPLLGVKETKVGRHLQISVQKV
jgi:hypothetical protein